MDKVERLVEINYSIEGIHTTGNLRDQHYANLKNEISTLCKEIFRERMKSLDKLPEQDKVNLAKLVKKIKDEISQARSIGIINDLHFSLLDEKLSSYENNKTKQ